MAVHDAKKVGETLRGFANTGYEFRTLTMRKRLTPEYAGPVDAVKQSGEDDNLTVAPPGEEVGCPFQMIEQASTRVPCLIGPQCNKQFDVFRLDQTLIYIAVS